MTGPARWSWAWLLLVIPLNALLVRFGYAFYLSEETVSSFWPSAGFLLAVFVRAPQRRLAPVFLFALLGQLGFEVFVLDRGGILGLFYGVINGLEALLGAILVRQVSREPIRLESLRELVTVLGFGGLAAPVIGATLGAWVVTSQQTFSSYFSVWSIWYAADVIGIFMVAPALLSWTAPERSKTMLELGPRRRIELVALWVAALGVGEIAFGPFQLPFRSVFDFPYIVLPVLVWAAVRFGPRTVATLALAFAVLASSHAAMDQGPFISREIEPDPLRTVLDLQSFLGLGVLSALVAGVLALEHKRATDRQARIEDELRQAQKLEALGRLAGGVAHDFNNMLTVIRGNLELLEVDRSDSILSGEEHDEILAQALQASDRARGLVRQLLAFSRCQVLESKVLDLNEAVEGLMKMLERLLPEPIDLDYRRSVTAAWITTDAGQLEQVVVNLVVNARDAMPDGGVVTIRVLTEDDAVVLEVEDNGSGMDSATREQALLPFFTTKPVGEGTGLGLSTVLGIVEQHGGRLDLDSEVGRGTVIRCRWPRSSPPPMDSSEREVTTPG